MTRLGNFSFNYSNNTITFGGSESKDGKPNDTTDVVIIGYQSWLKENLKTTTFSNGDTIFHAISNEDWIYAKKNKIPAWCYYNNDEFYDSIGKIYNWYAVTDKRGINPQGFHLPSIDEWNILIKNLGGESLAGELLRKPTEIINDQLKFNGELGGLRNEDSQFKDLNEYGHWWTTSIDKDNPNFAFSVYINKTYKSIYKGSFNKGSGFYIRCIKD
jgi:uncharacterized protein (TIGR02145 family)